jgi:hypothetical protein
MPLRPVILLAFAAALSPAPPEAAGRLEFRVTPAVIEVGSFYGGSRMRLEGAVSAQARVAVVVRGPGREETFNRKGKVGPIWVTTGKVHVSGVPSLFLRFTSGPLRSFLSREAIDKHQLDEASIRNQMRIKPDRDRDVILAGWLNVKGRDGTYALVRDGVKMGAPGAGGVPFTVEFAWPKKAPPGQYEVSVYECRDGAVARAASSSLPVVEVGFPAWLSGIAENRAALYGLVAVVAAALAGFGIDFLATLILGRRRARAH